MMSSDSQTSKGMKTEKDLKPLIDGDVLVYRCGFAADGQIKKRIKEDNPGISAEEIDKHMENTEYTSLALQNIKTVLEAATHRFNEEYKLFVHKEGNFRFDIATIKPYKGNRIDARKPKYYQEMKDYMFDVWRAIPVRGQESDDAIGIEQFDNPDKYTVIYSIDKDMLCIPGWHYNWVKEELHYQTITEANLFFFWQMMVGDTTDNIPGINKVGVKTASRIIEEEERDVDRVREAVKQLYMKQYGEDWESAYQEVGNLLYIRRRPDERCPLL